MATWPADGGSHLRSAREALSQGQERCAAELRGMGMKVDQGGVSRYENGRKPRDESARILLHYIEGVESRVVSDPTGEESLTDTPSTFDQLVRGATDEPLLGPRQGDLVDAMIRRLGTSKGSMNEWDYKTFADLRSILRLDNPRNPNDD